MTNVNILRGRIKTANPQLKEVQGMKNALLVTYPAIRLIMV
ncbi:MAG: hypothetical protein ABSF71_28405 [Terriglobia bacterium]|jgi:hypothetical protein